MGLSGLSTSCRKCDRPLICVTAARSLEACTDYDAWGRRHIVNKTQSLLSASRHSLLTTSPLPELSFGIVQSPGGREAEHGNLMDMSPTFRTMVCTRKTRFEFSIYFNVNFDMYQTVSGSRYLCYRFISIILIVQQWFNTWASGEQYPLVDW